MKQAYSKKNAVVTTLILALLSSATLSSAYASENFDIDSGCRDRIEAKTAELNQLRSGLSDLSEKLDTAKDWKTGMKVIGISAITFGLLRASLGQVGIWMHGGMGSANAERQLVYTGVAMAAGGGVLVYMSDFQVKKVKGAIARQEALIGVEAKLLKEEMIACEE